MGAYNTASGNYALHSNTTGDSNTAAGAFALTDNSTGNNNTATGYQALANSATADANTADGYQALNSNTTGESNTASGYQALFSNTTGQNNTASGNSAFFSTARASRIGSLLAMAGVRDGADGVLLRGADNGEVPDGAGGRQSVRFERSLPLEKALAPEVLIVTEMDGDTLPLEHGGPVRAVVGGWYGMASVKWLTRVTVTRQAPLGFWETVEYAYLEPTGYGARTRVPVREMLPKAQITEPDPGASVRLGERVVVRGFAWAGEASVAHVEFNDDGSARWRPVRLLDEPRPRLWTRWEFEWCPDRAGARELLVRCHDDRGRSQPLTRDHDRGTYMINEVTPYRITVRG